MLMPLNAYTITDILALAAGVQLRFTNSYYPLKTLSTVWFSFLVRVAERVCVAFLAMLTRMSADGDRHIQLQKDWSTMKLQTSGRFLFSRAWGLYIYLPRGKCVSSQHVFTS